jgi:hypothetical protein
MVVSVWFPPGLYNEKQLPLQGSLKMAIRRDGGWCVMAASLQGHEVRNVHMVEDIAVVNCSV